MTKKMILVMFVILAAQMAEGQQEGRMETDRPDQTESPFITKKHYMQGELGFSIENEQSLKSFYHPSSLLKYGLSERFEFRVITTFMSYQTPLVLPQGNKIITGVEPLEVGGKISLWEEKKIIPKTSLIFHVDIPPFSTKAFRRDKWAPSFRFTMQNTLTSTIGLGYNLGAAWDGISNKPVWAYTVSPGFNIGKRWYAYIEAFGFVRKDIDAHSIDGGFAYYITGDHKIDISASKGLTTDAVDSYVAIGYSFRFNTGTKK